MLGAFAVGKTSMASRFVLSTFSDKYLTTVGVKVDKKILKIGEEDLTLMIWDLAGEDDFQKVQMSYFRGASGFLLIVDGTRRSTLETALTLKAHVEQAVGQIPFVVVFNKADLAKSWEIDTAILSDLASRGWTIVQASAKTGQGVEEAFQSLAQKLLT